MNRNALIATTAIVMAIQPAGAAQQRSFDIPAQSIQRALNSFAKQANIQIIAARRVIRGKRANIVRGNMSVEAAIDQLLRGTGLSAHAVGPNTYAVVATAARYRPTDANLSMIAAIPATVATGAQADVPTATEGPVQVAGAAAQQIDTPVTPPPDPESDGDIVVVGSRASQQSANNRKRAARTATDSIVADDIGSFPDRNVNEAISRIPGVALNRNEFGEGDGVVVRGNGPDLTRIELDGLGVQSTNVTSGGPSRSADLRELPAELVKSVDVVKGSTADMTEGGLGGTVQIKTRSGLDFVRPYFSLRGGLQQNSLGQKWTPDFNVVTARRFFDGRLGVIASGTYSNIQNNSHGYMNTTSGTSGFSRTFDFDNSPEKTFEYNLASLAGDAADAIFANSTESPRSILTKSIAARTKADCLTAFPNNPAAVAAQRAQRILEQQSCLNQWNENTPSLIRHFVNTQTEQRYSFDARVDYRVTDTLTVYAKGTIANREVHDQNRSRNPVSGNVGIYNANVAGTFIDSTTGYPLRRAVNSADPRSAGFYLYDPSFGLSNLNNNAVLGNVLNVLPGSVQVDGKHNITGLTLTNGVVNIDQIENTINAGTKYAQGGAEYRGERLDIDFVTGYSSARTTRNDMRTSRSAAYGNATLMLQPNGLYDVELPAGYDDGDASKFVVLGSPVCILNQAGFPNTGPGCIGQAAAPLSATNAIATPAYTVAQLPLTTPSFSVSYTPRLSVSEERQAKLDVSYRTDDLVPFITRIKAGAMYRNNTIDFWGSGGYTAVSQVGTFGQTGYVPAVIVPTAQVRGTFRGCQPTAISTVPCDYGFVRSTNPANIRSGVDTLTPQQLLDLFTRTLERPDSEYFGDLPSRGKLPSSWGGIRTDALFDALGGSQFMNTDCLITCVGSDGKTYAQPVQSSEETIKNIYAMVDFEQRLPLGLRFTGNLGVRGVFINRTGSGLFTINTIRVTPQFTTANPNAPAGIVTLSASQNTTLKRSSTDWLPSFNGNLWAFGDKVVARFYGGKTVAQPPVANLLPAGNCTIDERALLDGSDDGDQFGCGGRVGNPGLKPFTAWSYNASLEWYPNADTLISAAVGKLDVQIGGPIPETLQQRFFEGSSAIDPITGQPLGELLFSVPTYVNGPAYSRDIYEFAFKTAFTFLPSVLRYTGVDANLSILKSSQTTGTRDPLTAEFLLPPNESKYYLNTSVWYDDGKLNLRLAYQKRTSRFIAVTQDINYPGYNWPGVRLLSPGYNPGVARFQDGNAFIDAKASYNITPEFQIYVEGRNLTRQLAQSFSTGKFQRFEDGTPRITNINYAGRRILFGARLQFGAGGR